MGMSFIALNAPRSEECILRVLQAGSIAHLSSELELCMQIATPAKSVFAMNLAAHIRFIPASELGLSELLCAPTNITGIGHSSSVNARAADPTAKLSVPIPIIIPLAPFSCAFLTSFAIRAMCSKRRSSLHILARSFEENSLFGRVPETLKEDPAGQMRKMLLLCGSQRALQLCRRCEVLKFLEESYFAKFLFFALFRFFCFPVIFRFLFSPQFLRQYYILKRALGVNFPSFPGKEAVFRYNAHCFLLLLFPGRLRACFFW